MVWVGCEENLAMGAYLYALLIAASVQTALSLYKILSVFYPTSMISMN